MTASYILALFLKMSDSQLFLFEIATYTVIMEMMYLYGAIP